MQIPADPNPQPKSIRELQEENARLKSLVVTLSALVLKNVAHESSKHPHSKAGQEQIAEALEDAGKELMAKAVEMKSVLTRKK